MWGQKGRKDSGISGHHQEAFSRVWMEKSAAEGGELAQSPSGACRVRGDRTGTGSRTETMEEHSRVGGELTKHAGRKHTRQAAV